MRPPAVGGRWMSATRPRLRAEERRQAVLDTACRRLLREELPRRDDGRDRPRGRDHRADPLPALRLEARPLPRLPRRGLAQLPRVRRGGAREDPGRLPRRDLRRLHGEALEAAARRPLDPGADRGLRGRGDREGRAAADPRGARLLRRRDPARAGGRRRSTPTATRSPRRGSSSPAACSRRSTTGSAACSAATSSACAPPAAPG